MLTLEFIGLCRSLHVPSRLPGVSLHESAINLNLTFHKRGGSLGNVKMTL